MRSLGRIFLLLVPTPVSTRMYGLLATIFLLGVNASFAQAPSPVSVSPSSGAGVSQNFTAIFSDPAGGGNITQAELYVMNSGVVPGVGTWSNNQCIFKYDKAANGILLVQDAGGVWTGPATVGTGAVISNSQCTIDASSSSTVISGTQLTVHFAVTFNGSSSFGAKQIYMQAANSTGWSTNFQTVFGTWSVPVQAAIPVEQSVSVVGQNVTANFTDTAGGSDISKSFVYFMPNKIPGLVTNWSANICELRYDTSSDSAFLLSDTGGAWLGPIAAGSSSTLSNSQCTLGGSGTSKTISGNNLTLHFQVTFDTTNFLGRQQIYLQAQNLAGVLSTNYQKQFGQVAIGIPSSPGLADLDNSASPSTAPWGVCPGPPCDTFAPTSYSISASTLPIFGDGHGVDAFATGAGSTNLWGVLWYYKTNALAGSNFQIQWRWQVTDVNYLQATEFDFPIEDSSNVYYFGSQCDLRGSGHWQFWNDGPTVVIGGITIAHAWNDIHTTAGATIPCTVTADTWNTLVWTATHSSTQLTYSKVQINGTTYNINLTLAAVPISGTHNPVGANHMAVQFQQDGRPVGGAGGGYDMYVDSMNAWSW